MNRIVTAAGEPPAAANQLPAIGAVAPVHTLAGPIEPLLVNPREAAAMLGLSMATFWRWHASGELPRGIKKSGKRLFSVAELRAFVEAGMPARAEWERQQAEQRGRPSPPRRVVG